MDFHDLYRQTGIEAIRQVTPVDPALWPDDGPGRSLELTPLYVTRYAGPRGSGPADHHRFWEMIFVFAGEGTLIGGSPRRLRSATAVLIPPGIDHAERPARDRGLDVLWIGLYGSRLAGLPTDAALAAPCPDVAALAEQLWLTAARGYGPVGPEMDGLTSALFGHLLRRWADQHRPAAHVIDEAVACMHREMDRIRSIAALAERFGYSEGHFYRLFRARTGVSPNAYLTRLRLDHDGRLLRESRLPIRRVAQLVGLQDPLYFSRLFKRHRGVAPTAWRTGRR